MGEADKPLKTKSAEIRNLEIWDTASVQKKHRFSYFREAVCTAFLQISPEMPETGFGAAQVKRLSITDGSISKLSASPHRATRGKSELAHIPEDYLSVNLQLTGRNHFRTSRDETLRQPGDLTLNYCNQPFSIDILPGEPYSMIGLFFKKSAIADFLKPGIQIQNANLSHHSLGPALIGCLSVLNRRYLLASEQELASLYSASISLITASLAQDAGLIEGIATDQTRVRDGLLSSIKSFIDDNLRDALLSPGMAAVRFGISVRYLHKLFSATGESFSDYVLSRRLEQAKQDLRDPAYDRLSIAEIGYRSGFNDLSSFYRNFKTRFDATPRQIRLMANEPPLKRDGQTSA
jgi:AraC-like DNA-binding protein